MTKTYEMTVKLKVDARSMEEAVETLELRMQTNTGSLISMREMLIDEVTGLKVSKR